MIRFKGNIQRGRGIKVGFSRIDAAEGLLANGVTIRHLNLFRNIGRLEIGENTYIANCNHFFGGRHYLKKWPNVLRIGANVNFMSRHFVDVTGDVEIGDGVVIAGRDTQIWSHSKAPGKGLHPLTVRIGKRCYIGARCTLVGCTIPDDWVVGAGAVVVGNFDPEPGPCLLAGNPARICKRYPLQEEV